MPRAGRKRQLSLSSSDVDAPGTRAKHPRTLSPEPINAGEDEDLESILKRIKEAEESEALARQLQDEWNNEEATQSTVASQSTAAPTVNGDILDVDDDEDDEIIALDVTRMTASRSAHGRGVADRGAAPSLAGPSNTRKQSYTSSSPEEPPDIKLDRDRDFFTGIRPCSKCGADIESPRGYVTFSAINPPPTLIALLHACCTKCKTNHCRGCFKAHPCGPSCRGNPKDTQCTIPTCCAEIRAIALFEALGGFDRQYLGERANSDARAKDAASQRKKNKAHSVGPGGTGYGSGGTDSYSSYNYYDENVWPGGRGRGGRGRGRGRGRGATASSSGASASTAQTLAAHWDEVIVRAMSTIVLFLPDPYSDSAKVYDMLPHASIQPLLSLSHLPALLGDLLRNDSVSDWISRSEVYYATLGLLRRLADCELTLKVLIDEQWEKSKAPSIDDWMWGDAQIVWEKANANDRAKNPRLSRASPLYAHFKKLTRQCEAFLAGASQLMDVDGDEGAGDVEETAIKATSLCGDIIAARDDIDRAMKTLGQSDTPDGVDTSPGKGKGKGKGKGRDPAVDMEKAYFRACERLAFEHVSIGGPGGKYSEYNYAQTLKQTESCTRNPKDRLHLVKELAVTATCLPPGVWVRVDDVRNDAIKIMIAGPQGTPYEGGLFEFDCFMPLEYPNKPPLMHLRTTGGGRVRFNPNLYNTGKVCLSLLGTWPGRPEEQWSSNSTLLQVLVSIQSMILIDTPYFNEPGYGQANPKRPESIAYNKRTCLQTVRWAMIEWLKDEHRNGIWADVIASHFSIRKTAIRKTIAEWAKTQPLIRKYTSSTTRDNGFGMSVDPSSMPYPYSATALKQSQANAAAAIAAEAPMDLLAEFDAGVQRVESWGLTDGH